jgi:hypothetical protein
MSNLVQDAIHAGTPIYPDIAVNSDGTDNNITDSESGMPNVAATMQTGVPASGWPGNGIPIFNNMNRLFRIVTQWIRWFFSFGWHSSNTFYGGATDSGSTPTLIALSSINSALTRANCMIIQVQCIAADNSITSLAEAYLKTSGGVDYLAIPRPGGASSTVYTYIVRKTS